MVKFLHFFKLTKPQVLAASTAVGTSVITPPAIVGGVYGQKVNNLEEELRETKEELSISNDFLTQTRKDMIDNSYDYSVNISNLEKNMERITTDNRMLIEINREIEKSNEQLALDNFENDEIVKDLLEEFEKLRKMNKILASKIQTK